MKRRCCNEGRRWEWEARSWKTGVGSTKLEVGSWKWEVRSRKTEVGCPVFDVGSQMLLAPILVRVLMSSPFLLIRYCFLFYLRLYNFPFSSFRVAIFPPPGSRLVKVQALWAWQSLEEIIRFSVTS